MLQVGHMGEVSSLQHIVSPAYSFRYGLMMALL
jgi:hypothetical protein